MLGSFSAAALMVATTFPAHAGEGTSAREPDRNAAYVNGGIGASDEQHMRQIQGLAIPHDLLGDQEQRIRGQRELAGNGCARHPRLQLDDAGPMTYTKLPAYRLTAILQGRLERGEVTLDGKEGRDVYFHWNGSA